MIYLDHAATTPVKPEVLEAMLPYFTEHYGNPSSIYKVAQRNKKAIDDARAVVAGHLGAQPNEIFFTSGGTEADNWAIKGMAEALKEKGNHIITTNIEHHAVLHPCQYLEKNGFEVTYLEVDPDGLVSAEQVEAAIRPETILITIMYANNEIGTIMPIAEIGAVAKKHGIVFHTDAVQAVGHLPIDVHAQNIDLLSLSGHKFYGPKGTGALYVRRGLKLPPLLHGGGQERNRRAGTENVPGIVGLAKALDLACQDMEAKNAKIKALRDYLIDGIKARIPYCRLNGHREKRLPNNVNFSFEFIEGESLLLLLDMEGIAASSGSACTSGSLDPSHVLLALGLPHEQAHGSVRFTLGENNTREEMDVVLAKLPAFVERLRSMSPLYEEFVRQNS
ncbi:MAG TPA: cysteine desulfurase NifS [Firmicutes bacterium]|uniref:Cysteine desulfurase IscS n=1 Tax=Capillibacterium thermochitinicola TaxID=2699427 RepID=A0A8J6I0Y0_9FIRM|nr:cysteine desulfurase NifS [Capillibacterium thermochitinicola]MBA2132284.1 cysteine desulfurase NifS [Capillibacterium thermochitinicola]HHW12630.1 cysteine desulfurase NifS [Bacillota bacterium]